MRPRVSAGLLLYRPLPELEVFIAHPGGPLFTHKDDGYWSIPKGEVEPGEELLATAIREFAEEVGIEVNPSSKFIPLGTIQQKGGKVVHAWAVEGEIDATHPLRSNTFTMEWPPGSGTLCDFPEIDRAQFFPVTEAKTKLKPAQVPLLDRLEQKIRKV